MLEFNDLHSLWDEVVLNLREKVEFSKLPPHRTMQPFKSRAPWQHIEGGAKQFALLWQSNVKAFAIQDLSQPSLWFKQNRHGESHPPSTSLLNEGEAMLYYLESICSKSALPAQEVGTESHTSSFRSHWPTFCTGIFPLTKFSFPSSGPRPHSTSSCFCRKMDPVQWRMKKCWPSVIYWNFVHNEEQSSARRHHRPAAFKGSQEVKLLVFVHQKSSSASAAAPIPGTSGKTKFNAAKSFEIKMATADLSGFWEKGCPVLRCKYEKWDFSKVSLFKHTFSGRKVLKNEFPSDI